MAMLSDQELISAYLDGELSGEDLARAKRLLATQPESRQLLEELQALRTSLQALPQHTLGNDFANSVLRRAEREILQPTITNAAPAARPTYAHERPSLVSWQRWQRPVAWAALATAAALVIMLFSPEQPRLALAPARQGGELNAPAAVDQAARGVTKKAVASAEAAGGQEHIAAHSARPDDGPQFSRSKEAGGSSSESYHFQVASPADISANEILVVHCDVPAGVSGEEALREILATNDIQWQSAPPDKLSGTLPAAKPLAGEVKEAVVQTTPREGQIHDAPQDAVYVVADSQQIAAALGAMESSRVLHNFSVEQVAAPAEALAYYDNAAPATTKSASIGNAAASDARQVEASPDDEVQGTPAPAAGQQAPVPYLFAKDKSRGDVGAAGGGQNRMMNEQASQGKERANVAQSGQATRVDLSEFESQLQLPESAVRVRRAAAQRDSGKSAAPQAGPVAAVAEDAKAGRTGTNENGQSLVRGEAKIAAPKPAQATTVQMDKQSAAQRSRALFIFHAAPEPAIEQTP